MARRTPVPALDRDSRAWAFGVGAACLLPLLLQLPGAVAGLIAAASVAVALLAWRRPVPGALRLLLALAVIGSVLGLSEFRFGRDTGCALLAAMLAIKPSETVGLRDGRSLVGFALFAPFATFLLDQGPLSLLLGMLAVLLALVALQRFAEQESDEGDPAPALWRRLAQVGRLVAIGLPMALAVFWLFPRLATPMWGIPERALARPGLSDRMTPGEWLDLINDETPALRVRFFGRTPPTSQMYWRGPVLWDFDGRSWTAPRWLRGVPPSDFRPGATRWDYEMEVEPTDATQLVALDLPLAAPEGSRLIVDHQLFAPSPLGALSRWRVRSAPPLVYQGELPLLQRRLALALPAGYNPRTVALARQWRAQAGNDDAAIVRRSLDWITREFAYTLDTPLPGRDSADEFLFRYKAGFCEHFSSAFVVLMRAAGIPARVVTGYVGGYRNPLGDYWLVRRSDAHAWAEVWLAGRGWVRVDPTAAVAPERIYDTLADRAPGGGGLLGGFGATTPLLNAADWLRRGWNDFMLGYDANRQQRLLKPLGIDNLQPAHLIALFSAAGGLAIAWMLWLSTRGTRQPDPVLRAWHRLDARYRRLGLGREPHEPAAQWAARVGTARPHAAAALRDLSDRFSQWRYADGPSERRLRRQLVRDLRAHRPG